MGFYLKRLYKRYVLNELDSSDIIISFPSRTLTPMVWASDYSKSSINKRSKYIVLGLFSSLVNSLLLLGTLVVLNDAVLSSSGYNREDPVAKIGLIALALLFMWEFISGINGLRWMIRMYNSPIKSRAKKK